MLKGRAVSQLHLHVTECLIFLSHSAQPRFNIAHVQTAHLQVLSVTQWTVQTEREVDLLQESEDLHLAASTGHISRKLLKYTLLSSFLRRGGTEQKQKIHIVQYRPAVPNK